MIVSSHVLNEVERLAERVIVFMHGRLAAAGGHRAIRDAMDDRPRHVLVRAPRRGLAAALLDLDVVGGVNVDGAASSSDRTEPATSPSPCPARPALGRRLERSGRSTTRSRACSGSWCDDRDHGCTVVHAPVSIPAKRWWTLALPWPPRSSSACCRSRRRPASDVFADIADVGLFSLLMPIVPRDRRRRARRRDPPGTFHFTWLSPTPTAHDRARRWLGGWLVALSPSARQWAGRGGQVPASAGPLAIAAAAGRPVRRAVHRRRVLHPANGVWSPAVVFLVERLLGAALPGSPKCRRPGCRGPSSSACFDDPPRRLLRDGVPLGNDAIVRLAIVTVVSRSRSRPGA